MTSLKDSLSELQKKAKERTVKTQNIEYDLDTLVRKVKNGFIKLDPEYQRRHRWPNETSSRLIESLILNIPIPIVYISQDVDVDLETEDARYTVIDGQQRLTAIVKFMSNEFPLCGLTTLGELNDCNYKDLPPFLVRRLEERTIKCLRIDSTVDAQVKYDIFERLNSGSVKLESQELRNAVHRGPFNKLIKILAKNEHFRVMLGIDGKNPDSDAKVQKMLDAEFVLRFFALSSGRYIGIKKGFKQFLDDSMEEFNRFPDSKLKEMEKNFIDGMEFLHARLGDYAFSRFSVEAGSTKRVSKFNAAVFDAVSVGVCDSLHAGALRDTPGMRQNLADLFSDKKFEAAISGSIADPKKIEYRINVVKAAVR